ncbi:MAG: hypothetical protein WKF75_20730 [Singulisphaera sp.]
MPTRVGTVDDFRILQDREKDALGRVPLIARTRVRLDEWVLGLVDGDFVPAFDHLYLAPPVLSPWPPCATSSLPRMEHEHGPTRLRTSPVFLLALLLLAGISFAMLAGGRGSPGSVVLVGRMYPRVHRPGS